MSSNIQEDTKVSMKHPLCPFDSSHRSVIAKGRSLSRSSSPTPSEGGTPEKDQLPQVDNDSFVARVSLSSSEICMYKTVIVSDYDV